MPGTAHFLCTPHFWVNQEDKCLLCMVKQNIRQVRTQSTSMWCTFRLCTNSNSTIHSTSQIFLHSQIRPKTGIQPSTFNHGCMQNTTNPATESSTGSSHHAHTPPNPANDPSLIQNNTIHLSSQPSASSTLNSTHWAVHSSVTPPKNSASTPQSQPPVPQPQGWPGS